MKNLVLIAIGIYLLTRPRREKVPTNLRELARWKPASPYAH
jgi:hypothetical protein